MRALLLALILFASAAQAQDGAGVAEERPTPQENENGQTSSGQGGSGLFPVPVRIVEDSIESSDAKAREDKRDALQEEDLKAQEKAANAAVESAASAKRQENLARWQIGLSLAGILALLYTLYLTRVSIRDNRAIGRAEVRASLASVAPDFKWRIDDGDNIIAIELSGRWKNVGKSEARSATFFGDFKPIKPDEFGPPIPDFSIHGVAEKMKSIVDAGDGVVIPMGDIKREDAEAFSRGEIEILIYSAVRYTDIFDVTTVTETCSCAVHSPRAGDERAVIRFKVYPHHNSRREI